MRRVIRISGVVLLGIVLALIAAEVGTRAYLSVAGHSEEYTWEAASRWRNIHRLSENKDILYDLVPGATTTVDYGRRGTVEYSISSQGIRDRFYATPKPEGTRRILVIGDSVTFGYYVPAESTFVAKTERLLQRRGGNVEVLNCGVGGYNTHNEIAWLIEHGLSLEPDIVVLAFCPNDVDNPYFHFSWHTLVTLGQLPAAVLPDVSAMRTELPAPPSRAGVFLKKSFRVMSFLEQRITRLQHARAVRLLLSGGEESELLSRLPFGDCLLVLCDQTSNEVSWLRSQLAWLDSVATENRFLWAVLALPMSYQGQTGPATCARQCLAGLSEERRIMFMDPLETPPDSFRYLFYDVTHLSPRGHQWVADVTAPALESLLAEQQRDMNLRMRDDT